MYLDLLILSNLLSRPSYGYEIRKSVERIVGGAFPINNNVLYPSLRKFEQMGAVEKQVKHQEGKPDRHIYHATDLGREVFGTMLRHFPPEVAKSDAEFLTRVAFFHLLDLEERLRLLETRQKILGDLLEHLSAVGPGAEAKAYPYAARIVEFRRSQVKHEYEWNATLAEEMVKEGHT